MNRLLTAALALASLTVPLLPFSAFAGNVVHGRTYSGGKAYSGDPYGEPPEAYSNCFVYSPRLHTSVWVCGAPYPPGRPALRSGSHGTETYANCLAYSRTVGTSVWVCGPPYPRGVPILAQ